uniref:Uncharacterized protein n=1 Tax=Rhizophora mucronata TaxID=61149 RepID=A0A2P2PN08_RHIMU
MLHFTLYDLEPTLGDFMDHLFPQINSSFDLIFVEYVCMHARTSKPKFNLLVLEDTSKIDCLFIDEVYNTSIA